MPIRNPQQMLAMINGFRNQDPSAFVMNLVNEAASQGNPIMQNLARLIQQGNTQQIETIVRNIAKEQGIKDFDEEFKAFKQMFRL